jgi:glycosyltransferase involved in cell wall biosynthesis
VTLRAAHQVVPTLSPGDGVGNYALALRGILRSLGLESELLAGAIDPSLRDEAHSMERFDAMVRPGDALLYHFAIASPELDRVLAAPARRVLVYQNPTPEEWFDLVSARNFERTRRARAELPRIAPALDMAVTLSHYSQEALEGLGIPRRAVWAPAVAPPAGFVRTPEPATVLGVGRIVPNKRWEVLIRAMAALRRTHPQARCELVGNPAEMEPYAQALERLARRLDSGTTLRGKVDDAELERAYARCTVMAFPSGHEGFGVPLAEAMARGIPLVTSRHTAVGEVGLGAVLQTSDDPLEVAEALALVLDDAAVAAELSERSRRRAEAYSPAELTRAVREALDPWGLPS